MAIHELKQLQTVKSVIVIIFKRSTELQKDQEQKAKIIPQ